MLLNPTINNQPLLLGYSLSGDGYQRIDWGGYLDEFAIFMAPSLLGGTGLPMVGSKGWKLAKMPRLNFQMLEKCGDDLFIQALPMKEK